MNGSIFFSISSRDIAFLVGWYLFLIVISVGMFLEKRANNKKLSGEEIVPLGFYFYCRYSHVCYQ